MGHLRRDFRVTRAPAVLWLADLGGCGVDDNDKLHAAPISPNAEASVGRGGGHASRFQEKSLLSQASGFAAVMCLAAVRRHSRRCAMSKCAFCCMGCPNPHRKLGKLITRHRSLRVPKASRVTSRASDSFYVDLAVSWMLHRGLAGDASSCCPKTRHVSVNPSCSLFVPCDLPLLGGYPYSQYIPQYDVVVFTSCSIIPI